VDVTALDGRGFGRFVVAGTYFLRKYRGVLNDLNVFPVPDGDTGSNMYLTLRSALTEVSRAHSKDLAEVAAAAAHGSLLGARGNSGVILSQMLRGFAHNVRHRESIDTLDLAIAMREAVGSARAALMKPVEGTIISVAAAAADSAYTLAQRETDFYRLTSGVVRAAADALERTPEQLQVLKDAGVVDSGGAGFVYLMEGILRFLPDSKNRATAFPRRPSRQKVFTSNQIVSGNKFCTEFVLEDATIEQHPLRDLLAERGDSLLVVGSKPTLKVHIHTSDPAAVQALAAGFGRLTREKVEDMERQHNVLIVGTPAKPVSVVAVVSGQGFADIARELGADVVIVAKDANPSVRELVVGINSSLARRVYVLANDPNVALAAKEAAALCDRDVVIVPTRDVPSGLAVQLGLANVEEANLPSPEALMADAARVGVAQAFYAGKDSTFGGVALKRGAPAVTIDGKLHGAPTLEGVVELAVRELSRAGGGGLATLYYGESQKERDVRALVAKLAETFAELEIEYYYGGQRSSEYVIAFER
jgi:DAK2 domain fusion protein YloV